MTNEEMLGRLAFEFRGNRDPEFRAKIAQQYAMVVFEMIESGLWAEMPAFEEQLPDEFMPQAFFQYWGLHPRG